MTREGLRTIEKYSYYMTNRLPNARLHQRVSPGRLGAMGKRTRLPVEPRPDVGQHGQANTLDHGPTGETIFRLTQLIRATDNLSTAVR
jgi:hypothetical protein